MNDDVKFILYTIDDEYVNSLKESDVGNLRINWASVLRTALNNRILYTFSKSALAKLPLLNHNKILLETITKEGDRWLNKFYSTLSLLKYYMKDNYIVIKTFKFFQDITFDVDIVQISDAFEQINKLSKEADFKLNKINGGYELIPMSESRIAIDVYTDFLFRNRRILNSSFICNKPQLYKTLDNFYYIPHAEGELLLYIAQINFQLRFLTLHDFLQITKTISKSDIDWESLLTEVAKYNWEKSFVKTISIVNGLYLQLYGVHLDIPIKPNKNVKYQFPYFLSPLSTLKYDFNLFGYQFFRNSLIDDLKYFIYKFISYHIRKRIPIYREWIDLNSLRNTIL